MEPIYYVVKQINGDYAHLQMKLADGSFEQEEKLVTEREKNYRNCSRGQLESMKKRLKKRTQIRT